MTGATETQSISRAVMRSSALNTAFLERLAQQQFWLFGADIRRPDGNLLLELGFRRVRAPDPSTGSSCFTGSLGDEDVVAHLWGFGCCLTLAKSERIYLSRYRARAYRIPATADLERMHASTELNALRLPPEHGTLADHEAALFRWFAMYERTVQARLGLDARVAVLGAYGARQVGTAWEIPEQWEQLASESRGRSMAQSARNDEAITVMLPAR